MPHTHVSDAVLLQALQHPNTQGRKRSVSKPTISSNIGPPPKQSYIRSDMIATISKGCGTAFGAGGQPGRGDPGCPGRVQM